MGSSPISVNPTTGKSQVLGSSGQQVPTVNANGTPIITPPTAPSLNLTPAYATSVLGGLPNLGTSQAANAPKINSPIVGTDTTNQDLSNPALAQALYAQLQPQFQGQNRALSEQLANAGIVGGSSAGAQNALNSQQQTQLMGELAPLDLQQEQMALGQAQTNAASQNQGNQFNATNNLNAQTTTAANLLNNNQYNSTAANQMGQFNVGNDINLANSNASIYNNSVANAANFQNQDYLAQLQAATDLQTNNAASPTSNFIAQQYQPSQVSLSSLGNLSAAPTINKAPAAPVNQDSLVPAANASGVQMGD